PPGASPGPPPQAVMAPTPVITTRCRTGCLAISVAPCPVGPWAMCAVARSTEAAWPLASLRAHGGAGALCCLGQAFEVAECPAGNGLDELPPDDRVGGPGPNQRPAQGEPVLDRHQCSFAGRLERPCHRHPARYPAHVQEGHPRDLREERLHRPPAHGEAIAVRGHLDELAVSVALEHGDPAVVW